MERFVIGAAVALAALIVMGSVFGKGFSEHGGLVFDIGDRDSGGGAALAGTGSPSTVASKPYAGVQLKVRDAAAVLKIIPEDRTDIAVEIANPGRLVTPSVRLDGTAVVVDGNLGRRVRDCDADATSFSVTVNGVGRLEMEELPVITARVPRAADVSVGGAVWSEVGPSQSADLSFTGCGPAKIADVTGELDLRSAGSGSITAGAAGTASVSAAGSGDASVGAVAGKLSVSVAGSGDVEVASLTGPLDVSIAGSGDVTVKGGAVSDSDISIAGSGGVDIVGAVAKLDVSIMGSGDVTVRGAAQSVDANIMGSGDVQVVSVTGGVQKAVMGSGSVTVGPIHDN
jgi:Putative auto-transporter adhesin, head GIN domain